MTGSRPPEVSNSHLIIAIVPLLGIPFATNKQQRWPRRQQVRIRQHLRHVQKVRLVLVDDVRVVELQMALMYDVEDMVKLKLLEPVMAERLQTAGHPILTCRSGTRWPSLCLAPLVSLAQRHGHSNLVDPRFAFLLFIHHRQEGFPWDFYWGSLEG